MSMTEHTQENKKPENSGTTEEKREELLIQIKESEYKKLLDELAQYKDKYVRLYAEFENARKRMEREKFEFVKFANEELIVEFLGILDNLERSIEVAKAKHQDYTAFLQGVEMIMAHIYDLLKKNGVKTMDVKGKMFDPHCHEVLMQEESDQLDDGVILEELQKGYYLGDRVIRTAKVKVAKKVNKK